jgi:two-component system sensor histidine kinase/response regulator
LQLIDRILDFSIVESGKSLLKMSEFSLYDLARLVLHQLEEDAESKQIELQLDCRLDIDTDFFRGDRDRLQQILLNLISNGIKFTPAGGKVVLRIWQEKERAFFAVEDTGIGIPSQQLPLLFKKFQQLDSSRQRTYNGAGLGLALTKQLIELHGGKIEVNSIPKKGSTFTFYLPTNSPDKKQINSSITISDKIMSKTRTIVLIEEDEELATLICELLTAGNCQIVWLVDASDAIEQIELLEPILTIIDCRINNFQQLAQLLKSSPKTRHIKIMGLRSALPKNNWENCSQPEIDDYLIEPIQPTILLEKINNLF